MKMTKSDLKAIVKECLVEILNEGLGGSMNIPKISGPFNQKINASQSVTSQMFADTAPPRSPAPALREAIKDVSGGNKIMESIFADTAAKTLPTMLQNDRPGVASSVGGGLAEQVVAQAEPDQLFGEDAAAKWASLAFMDSPKK
jgi:hypothetical protein